METNRTRIFRSVVAALALVTASAAHGVVYKWVEEDGNVIYSNEPPSDPGKVHEFTRIDDLSLVPGDRGAPELRAEEKEKPRGASEVASPAPAAAPSTPTASPAPAVASPAPAVASPAPPAPKREEAVTLIPREPVTLLPKDSTATAPPRETAERPPRVIPRSTHSAAVQDPCLVSPDPRCHERNKGNYHPARGYIPPEPGHAVGASSSAAAGGAVGGQVPAQGVQALPPGSAPSSVSIEWSRR